MVVDLSRTIDQQLYLTTQQCLIQIQNGHGESTAGSRGRSLLLSALSAPSIPAAEESVLVDVFDALDVRDDGAGRTDRRRGPGGSSGLEREARSPVAREQWEEEARYFEDVEGRNYLQLGKSGRPLHWARATVEDGKETGLRSGGSGLGTASDSSSEESIIATPMGPVATRSEREARSTEDAAASGPQSKADITHGPKPPSALQDHPRPPPVIVAPVEMINIPPISPPPAATSPNQARPLLPSALLPRSLRHRRGPDNDDDNPLPQITTITLLTEDLHGTIEFYDQVFTMSALVHEDAVSATYEFNGGQLLVVLLDGHEAREKSAFGPGVDVGRGKVEGLAGTGTSRSNGKRVMLSVLVGSVDDVWRRLQAKGAIRGMEGLSRPTKTGLGRRAVTFIDPGGHTWEVWEKIGR
ncbi:hypothetical protein M406DRAFT_72236 [Cryphonectria parasitica EP155]|uniref:VOC domain-containing protein n=1 Tax=Cryphonectria parasitica (strain ATCC 38755 / EP155) TaxID=660469 RepID=A0A9P4XVU1_CRYP1|nr:uncharacterized protein M406DRAFT_72236 [Cryphonectria parasitica EP155]KAF3762217.1 hypothetical protein M406DRAFT_72236 [Cryphonectria parasitica EP155]